jgi:MFS family permease
MAEAPDREEPARGAGWLARILPLLLGAGSLAVALGAYGRYGWRRLEVHGDGAELLLAASLFALGLGAAAAGVLVAWVPRRRVVVLGALLCQLAALFVLACGGAHLDRCVQREGPNPPMRWWPLETAG